MKIINAMLSVIDSINNYHTLTIKNIDVTNGNNNTVECQQKGTQDKVTGNRQREKNSI